MTTVIVESRGPACSIHIRSARADDDAALGAMFDRCSKQTRYRRFHGFVTRLPDAYLRQCLTGHPVGQQAIVAELITTAGTPRLVGLASIAPVPHAHRVHELGALVEDEWQLRGVGRRLVGELFTHAYLTGVQLIRMQLCREQRSLLTYVTRRWHVVSTQSSGCDVTVDVSVPVAEDPLRGFRSPAAATAP